MDTLDTLPKTYEALLYRCVASTTTEPRPAPIAETLRVQQPSQRHAEAWAASVAAERGWYVVAVVEVSREAR